MKIKRILLSILAFVVIILELLPNGVILRFANPIGAPLVQKFCYFSLTPFGYGNFGPFITALLTCVIPILVMIGWFRLSKAITVALMIVSGVATVISLTPLVFGIEYFTVIGIGVSVLLGIIFCMCFVKPNWQE